MALYVNLAFFYFYIKSERRRYAIMSRIKKRCESQTKQNATYEFMNASKLLVKQHRLNANVYLYFLLKPHKAMTVKELRKKKNHKDKKKRANKKSIILKYGK